MPNKFRTSLMKIDMDQSSSCLVPSIHTVLLFLPLRMLFLMPIGYNTWCQLPLKAGIGSCSKRFYEQIIFKIIQLCANKMFENLRSNLTLIYETM